MIYLKTFFVLTLFSWLLCTTIFAQPQWKARWITHPEIEHAPNTWLCFRTTVDLNEMPQSVSAKIAVDSKYWLWINDELVVYEGQLKRGPNPQDTYFDEVPIAKFLKSGKNTVAVLVCFFGREGFSHKNSGRAGLVFDCQHPDFEILSSGNWRVQVHPAYSNTDDPQANYRLPESNIHFDARKDVPDWYTTKFDDHDWLQAVEMGNPPVAPWNRLWKRPTPLTKNYGLKPYVQHTTRGDTIIAKLPYNAHISPYLKVKAPAGERIQIYTDNFFTINAKLLRAEYITKAGIQTYENLGWLNGHAVYYILPKNVEVIALAFRETGYDTDFTGAFTCDNPFLNRLWEKAQRTLYLNMCDTYTDCPDRERAQWWGDVVLEMGESFYALDTRAIALARKGILELCNWQRADSTLYSPVPSGNWDKELPQQMLASVGRFGFWTYYWYTGDLETIQEIYPAVKSYLALWKVGADGAVPHRAGGWDWSDWGGNIDKILLDHCWYQLALMGQLEMARITGNSADIPGIDARMQRIKNYVNSNFWNGFQYRSPQYTGETDDRGNALAVLAGFAEPSQFPAITKILEKIRHASPYMEKYVLEALLTMGETELALQRMQERYKTMVESPLTTLWEIFEQKWSLNHGWTGGPLTLLSQYIAGIAPEAPGFRRFHVNPRPGKLKKIATHTTTVQGEISFNLQWDENQLFMHLKSPAGSVARLGVPKLKETFQEIQINRQRVWPGVQTISGIKYLGETVDDYAFELPAGDWKVIAR